MLYFLRALWMTDKNFGKLWFFQEHIVSITKMNAIYCINVLKKELNCVKTLSMDSNAIAVMDMLANYVKLTLISYD